MSKPTEISYKRKKSLVFEEIDGKVHILDDKKDAIVTFNETATLLWNELASKKTLDELSGSLVKEFGITELQAKKDTKEFIAKVKKLDLVEH